MSSAAGWLTMNSIGKVTSLSNEGDTTAVISRLNNEIESMGATIALHLDTISQLEPTKLKLEKAVQHLYRLTDENKSQQQIIDHQRVELEALKNADYIDMQQPQPKESTNMSPDIAMIRSERDTALLKLRGFECQLFEIQRLEAKLAEKDALIQQHGVLVNQMQLEIDQANFLYEPANDGWIMDNNNLNPTSNHLLADREICESCKLADAKVESLNHRNMELQTLYNDAFALHESDKASFEKLESEISRKLTTIEHSPNNTETNETKVTSLEAAVAALTKENSLMNEEHLQVGLLLKATKKSKHDAEMRKEQAEDENSSLLKQLELVQNSSSEALLSKIQLDARIQRISEELALSTARDIENEQKISALQRELERINSSNIAGALILTDQLKNRDMEFAAVLLRSQQLEEELKNVEIEQTDSRNQIKEFEDELFKAQKVSNTSTALLEEKSVQYGLLKEQHIALSNEILNLRGKAADSYIFANEEKLSSVSDLVLPFVYSLQQALVRYLDAVVNGTAQTENVLRFIVINDTQFPLDALGNSLSNVDNIFIRLKNRTIQYEQDLESKEECIRQLKSNYEQSASLSPDSIINLKEIQNFLVVEREEKELLAHQNESMMERLREMKATVGPRLQAEIALLIQVQTQTAAKDDLFRKAQGMELEITRLNTLLSQANSSTSISWNVQAGEIEKLQEHLLKCQRDVTRLTQHLIEAEEMHTQDALKSQLLVDEYKAQVERLEIEKTQFETMFLDRQEEIELLTEKTGDFGDMVELKQLEVEKLAAEARQSEISLQNLQHVLQDFQNSQEGEMEFALAGMKKQIVDLMASIDEWREKSLAADARSTRLEKSVPDVEKLKLEIGEHMANNRKLKIEAGQAQSHLGEAMRRMRDGTESTIDRRLIANLLVTFISSPRGDKTRYEMLNVISNVLYFTDDEKYKVGLGKRPVGYTGTDPNSPISSPTHTTDPANGSFSDLWVNFLLKSVSADEKEQGDSVERKSVDLVRSAGWFGKE